MDRKHIRYVMAVISLFLFAGAGPGLLLNTFTNFVKPMSDDLGYARTQISMIYTIEMWVSLLLMPAFGKLLKRVNVRNLLLLCGCTCVAALLGYSLSTELWHFYALAVIFGLAYNGAGFAAFGTLGTRWFVKKRNLITGIAYSGSGILPALLMPTINQLNALDWRSGYRLLGSVVAASMVIAWLLIRSDPSEADMTAYGAEEPWDGTSCGEKQGDTYRQALGQRVLWLYFITAVLSFIVLLGINLNCVAYLSDLGFDAAAAGLVSSVLMVSISCGKVLAGWMYDRLSFRRAMIILSLLQLISPTLLLFAQVPAIAYLAVAINGIAAGGMTVQSNAFTTALFGERDFSRIYSVVLLANSIGSSVGASLDAAIYDVTGSYQMAWVLGIGLSVVCLFLSLAVCRLQEKKRATSAN